MSADAQPSPAGVTDVLDALSDRVDSLSAMVREATGSVAANRGEVSSLDRRVQELIGAGSERTAAQLAGLRKELDAVRGFVAETSNRSGNVATAASDPLRETIAELASRIDTLGEVVRSTSGRMVGAHNKTSELASALAEQDARAEARFAEIHARLEAVSERAAQALSAPASRAADPGLEDRVAGKVGTLVERVDFLAETARATAGRLAATDGKLKNVEERSEKAITKLEQRGEETLSRTEGAVRAMRTELEAFKDNLRADPQLGQRMDGLIDSVEALGSRVGTLSGIVGETAGRVSGRELEIAALDRRLEEVGHRVEHVAHQLRHEIDSLGAVGQHGETGAELGEQTEAFGKHLTALEATVAETAVVTEQLGIDLRHEITSLATAVAAEHAEVVDATRALEARGLVLESRMDTLMAFASSSAARGSEEVEALAAAVARKHADVVEMTEAWEGRRAELEARMDDLAAVASATAERGADEMERALTILAERLERLERDRRAVATDATYVEATWAEERAALEVRLDEIAASITVDRLPAPDVESLVEELADRIGRMEGERETVADLAALADAWTTELSALEARVDQGLATLEEQSEVAVRSETDVVADEELSDSVYELASRIEQIERDRDAVRAELARTASSWASERAALQERVSELAARIVTGPLVADADDSYDGSGQTTQELDRLRIGVEGLRMRLAYHEKTVSDLAGSRGVMQRLDELSARVDQLAAMMATGATTTAGTAAAGLVEFHTPPITSETSGLLSRLDEADRLRNESREKMLEQMERIASRMDWRLQRLEAEGVPVGAFRN